MDYEQFYGQFHLSPEQEAASVTYYKDYAADARRLLPSGMTMLDVGCGWGHLMAAFQTAGFITEGIDISAGQVRAARARGHRAHHVGDSAGFLRAHPGAFDVITLFDVIEHLTPDEQIELMQGVGCALAPGGILLLKAPSAYSSVSSVMRYIDPTHHCALTLPVLNFMCRVAQLTDVEVREEHRYDKRPSYKKLFRRPFMNWLFYRTLVKLFRTFRRLELISELGATHANQAVLSPNLYLIARKPL